MSAFPLTRDTLEALTRPTARMVLESLQSRRQQAGREGLALRLGDAEPRSTPEDTDPFDALLMPGAVVELSALSGAGALSLAFRILEQARRRARAAGRPAWLCAVDPTRTLHGPAVAAMGLPLDSLVVVQPPEERLLRTAVRAARSGAFAGVVVDGSALHDVSGLVTGLRRLTLAAEEHAVACILLTSSRAVRGLPLPVASRALVESALGPRGDELHVRFLRHREGSGRRLVLPRQALRATRAQSGAR